MLLYILLGKLTITIHRILKIDRMFGYVQLC